MMKLLIVLLLNIVFIFSCNNTPEPEKRLNGLYKNFDKKYIEHFPFKHNYSFLKYSYLIPLEGVNENKGGYLKVLYSLKDLEIESLEKELKQIAIKETIHADSCNIFIERGVNSEIENPEKTCVDFYPVPVFLEEMDYFDVPEYTCLPKDFILYIIEAKKGIYFKEEFLCKKLTMPVEWKHGMSRGIALSKERHLAIFWIDIW